MIEVSGRAAARRNNPFLDGARAVRHSCWNFVTRDYGESEAYAVFPPV